MKSKFSFLIAMTVWLMVLSFSAFGATKGSIELPGEGVYAEAEKQHEVYAALTEKYQAIWEQMDRFPVMDSIQPIYYCSLRELAEEGAVRLHTLLHDKATHTRVFDQEQGAFFVKWIMADGQYASSEFLYIQEGKIVSGSGSPSRKYLLRTEDPEDFIDCNYSASNSYADHADRIRDLLKLDHIIPEQYVRFVTYGAMHYGFYINDGNNEGFYSIGLEFSAGGTPAVPGNWISMKQMIAYSKEYVKQVDHYLKEKENQNEEYADEKRYGGGFDLAIDPYFSNLTSEIGVQNINEIRGYFFQNSADRPAADVQAAVSPDPEKSRAWIFVSAGAATILVGGAFAVLQRKKKVK